jgi:putative membrane protein
MKSKVMFLSRFGIAVAALSFSVTGFAQMYSGGQQKPPSGTSTSTTNTPAPAAAEPYEPDNPFFRKKTKTTSPTPSPAAANKAKATKLSPKDDKFFTAAAANNTWEISTGEMAQKQAQTAPTKQVAARMISEHSSSNKELTDLAAKKGLSLSVGRTNPQKINPAAFDKNYLDLLAQDHQEEIALYSKEAKSGDDPDIRAWAKKALATEQSHMAAIKKSEPKE